MPKDVKMAPVSENRSYRRVPMARLTARLGLAPYNVPAPLTEEPVKTSEVKIMLSQHIGAPAAAAVKAGDHVTAGQVIGAAQDGKLGVNIHASVDGTVTEVSDKYVVIHL